MSLHLHHIQTPQNGIPAAPWRAFELPHTAEPDHTYWHIEGGDVATQDLSKGFDLAGFMTPDTAALIAATPALLDALNNLVGACRRREEDPDSTHAMAVFDGAFEKACALLNHHMRGGARSEA